MKIATALLLVLVLALGTALIVQQRRASNRIAAAESQAAHFSNNWRQARAQLEERERVVATIETNFTRRSDELIATTVELTQARTDLSLAKADLGKAQSDLRAARADLQSARTELERKAQVIAALEGERDDLTQRMTELTNSIRTLEAQIADTQGKLARAEGNRDFLLKELKRLQDEKGALAAQFSNLAALRAQIAKLKEEAVVNQRLTWMEKGIYQRRDRKGAEALVAPPRPPARPGSRLDVEVERTGESRVLPDTNAPPVPR
jgi:chromosome segregation ATPase